MGTTTFDVNGLEHDGPFTERDYLALEPGAARVELVEGTLLIGPGQDTGRARRATTLRTALEQALPPGLRVLGPVPMRLGRDCVLVPDLVVARAATGADPTTSEPADEPADEPAAVDATAPGSTATPEPPPADAAPPGGVAAAAPEVLDSDEVLIVVDVVDSGHGLVQRDFKPRLYARTRIPYAVLVDSGDGSSAATASASMLIGGRYHEFAHAAAGERLVLQEPFAVEFDLSHDPGKAAE